MPVTPAGVTAVLLGAGVATAVLSELVVEFEFELLEVEFEVVVFVLLEAVDFFVAVVLVAALLAVLFAVLFGAVVGVALAAGELFCAPVCAEVSAEAPARVEIPLEPNCGGVIESTGYTSWCWCGKCSVIGITCRIRIRII